MILLVGIICDIYSISKLVMHVFANSHLVSNFKLTIIMDSTLSDIFRTNHEQNTVEFKATRLGVIIYALTQLEGIED